MKKGLNIWIIIIAFLLGCFTSYFFSQYSFFDIKFELNVLELLVDILTIVTGLYIADTIQKRLTKNQNRSSYLVARLEKIWFPFSELSIMVSAGGNIQVATIKSSYKDIINHLGYFKSISSTYSVAINPIAELEKLLDSYETQISSCPTSGNVVQVAFPDQFKSLENQINSKFSKILGLIS